MIISDTPQHKIDVEFSTDGFLHLTTFHKRGDEWVVKKFGLSPATQDKLVAMIANQPRDSQSK